MAQPGRCELLVSGRVLITFFDAQVILLMAHKSGRGYQLRDRKSANILIFTKGYEGNRKDFWGNDPI